MGEIGRELARLLAWVALWGALALPASARAQTPPVAAVYPLATADGAPATVADLTLKAGLLASHRYRLVERAGPDDYGIPCVRSFFCLKALAEGQDVDRLIVGLIEPEGAQVKVYLVLFDARAANTLKAAEARMAPSALGSRLPALVSQLVADEPEWPAEAFISRPPPPVEVEPTLEEEQAEVVARLSQDPPEGRRAKPARSRPVDDDLDGDAIPLPPAFLASVHGGGAYLAGYALLLSGLDLEIRTTPGWVFSVSGAKLSGRDLALESQFYLLSAAASVDRLIGPWQVRPFAGVEGRVTMLAPQLTAAGGALRAGALYELTGAIALRAVGSTGVLYNAALPGTVYQLKAAQLTSAVQLQLVFTLL